MAITFKKLGVVFEYNRDSDAWEIEIPVRYSGKTEGLCGMADGEKANDLWMAGYSIPTTKSRAVETFFNHWLVNPNAGCYTDALASLDDSLFISKDFCAKVV